MTPSELLLSQLPLVHQVVGFIARRHHLTPDEADEVESYVRMRLIDHDYLILRRFAQRSRLSTYLTTVIHRLFLDYRDEAWGKWRPSAAARRLGAAAMALEELVYRDRLTLEEAIRVLIEGRKLAVTEEQLRAFHAEIPARPRRRSVAPEDLAPNEQPTDPQPSAELRLLHRQSEREIAAALAAGFRRLPAQDRLLLGLCFLDGMPVVEVSRVLSIPSRRVYKRIDALLLALRSELREAGIEADDVAALLSRASYAELGFDQPPTPGRIWNDREGEGRQHG